MFSQLSDCKSNALMVSHNLYLRRQAGVTTREYFIDSLRFFPQPFSYEGLALAFRLRNGLELFKEPFVVAASWRLGQIDDLPLR